MKTKINVTCLVLLLLLGSASAKDQHAVEVVEMAKSSTSWNGDDLPNFPTGKPEITILKIVIPAGTTLPMHKHPMINAGVLLKGELTVITQKNETLRLSAGDAIVEVVNQWHYGKNEGKEPAEIIVFYAGTVGQPLSIQE